MNISLSFRQRQFGRLPLLATIALLVVSSQTGARAHSVWIEPANGQMVIRFGELDGDVEKSPGHLDELSSPAAFVTITNAPKVIETTKKADHYLIAGTFPTNSICVETSYAVMSAPGKPGRKPNFYARWYPGTGEVTPALVLDLAPTGKKGEVRVSFRGQPLGGVKATLHNPDGKEQELTADAQGLLRFTTKDSGQYHLSIARHRENLAGFHNGLAYDLTSHNAALTWMEP